MPPSLVLSYVHTHTGRYHVCEYVLLDVCVCEKTYRRPSPLWKSMVQATSQAAATAAAAAEGLGAVLVLLARKNAIRGRRLIRGTCLT